jgi:hypothetical protein
MVETAHEASVYWTSSPEHEYDGTHEQEAYWYEDEPVNEPFTHMRERALGGEEQSSPCGTEVVLKNVCDSPSSTVTPSSVQVAGAQEAYW